MKKFTVAFAGNPNVGKSTVFNRLTGLHQHTGNWAGKTVALARGTARLGESEFELVDLPGCYSLFSGRAEENAAREYILSGEADAVCVICDATCLERSLSLALQVISLSPRTVICVNLMDEARRRGIEIDLGVLSEELGVSVIGTSARSGDGVWDILRAAQSCEPAPMINEYKTPEETLERSLIIAEKSVRANESGAVLKADLLLTGRLFGYGSLLILLAAVLWITISGANYPSEFLSRILLGFEETLDDVFGGTFIADALIHGMYRVMAWVVSVMLPPMAIFFPLFTILEDLGLLPRIAFNLDNAFKKCGACGKQALTMCMGFGCNAVGVSGTKIIDSPRERLIAILTNSFVPCNGRFPALISVISVFFAAGVYPLTRGIISALSLTLIILIGIGATFAVSLFLSRTILKGESSSVIIELPPFRRPKVGTVIVRSILDRCIYVLGRAVCVAAPAGIVIYLLANINVGGMTLLSYITGFLDPFARVFGLDGVILTAFILGLPANETVVPIIIMGYTASSSLHELPTLSALFTLFVNNGWTLTTAVCVSFFCLMHWPCSTTLITVYKETKSIKYTFLAFILPTLAGLLLCFAVNLIF